jgi:outer membrane protein insertion porin family
VPSRLLFVVPLLVSAVPMNSETCPQQKIFRRSQVQIRNIVFTSAGMISAEERGEMSTAVREQAAHPAYPNEELGKFDEALGASDLADEAAERVRAAYQDKGYFKVQVSDKAVRIDAASLARYDLVIRVDQPGMQYRLGDLRFTRSTAFPETQLRDLFPIQRGEIFSREKIAKGLEGLRRLYGSQGYINYTAVPATLFDDGSATINLQIDADEGRQFRMGHVEILGLDVETRSHILDSLTIRSGDVFSSESWHNLAERFPDLSLDDPSVRELRPNERYAVVDVVLDFRKPSTCPIDLSVGSAIPLAR